MKRGFTVVEILVTLVVIAILLGLGTVGLRSTLANGRDSERKSDIETIARGLEARYDKGNSLKALPQTTIYWPNPTAQGKGYYPGVNEVYHMEGGYRSGFSPETPNGNYTTENLPGTSQSALTTPSGSKLGQACVWMCQPAGNASQLVSVFGGSASSPQDKYIYESVDSNGNICSNGNCVAYNLYWISETMTTNYPDAGITGLQIHRSKHQ